MPQTTTPEIPLPILTPRLMLRPLQPGDGQMLLDYKHESWDQLAPWGIWIHPPALDTRTVNDDEAFCTLKFEKFQKREDLTFIALHRETDKMIGAGGLHNCDWNLPMFTLGFQTRTSETRKGYATEIARALTHYAFDTLQAHKVATSHADGNTGSQRVIEKLGFKKEGTLRSCHNLWHHGIVDEHHYGLLKGEFQIDAPVSWPHPQD